MFTAASRRNTDTTAFMNAALDHGAATAHFDLLAIGRSAGQKAAIQAAKLGKRVGAHRAATHMVGGVRVNTGTIPSKTLREAVLYLTGLQPARVYGQSYRVKDDITIDDLLARAQHVIQREIDVIRDQLAAQPRRPCSTARRASSTRTRSSITAADGGRAQVVDAENIVIATGTPPGAPRDHRVRRTHDPRLRRHPRPRARSRSRWSSSAPGVIGIEYASMFAALGTKVTVVEQRAASCSTFCDAEIVEALQYHLRDLGVTFRFGETVEAVERARERRADHARERQAHRRPRRALRRRPPGRDRRARPREGRPRGRRARPDRGRRALPDRASRTSTRSAT